MSYKEILKTEVLKRIDEMDDSVLVPYTKKLIKELINYYETEIKRIDYEADKLSTWISILNEKKKKD